MNNKFLPQIHRNEDGRMWEIYFKDEDGYVEARDMRVKAQISRETGEVVGIKILDEFLRGSRKYDYKKSKEV